MKNKPIAIFLGHPAHYHLFKNATIALEKNDVQVDFLVKHKDILEYLVQQSGHPYHLVRRQERAAKGKLGLAWSLISMELGVIWYILRYRPKCLVGTYAPVISHLTGVPMIICNEDDAAVVPRFAKTSYPYAKAILAPRCCNGGKWDEKMIKYDSFHELAYLHPNHFTPDTKYLEKYGIGPSDRFFVMRFASLHAHHDFGISGINDEIAAKLIEMLQPYGKVFITSERKLSPALESYRISIDPLDIHHVMAFASLYIGDSQTMAAEAAVLGVPFIRYNDFVGRIGYLNELENEYHLGFGIKASEEGSADKMYKTLTDLLSMPNLKEEWQKRRQKMLSEKIDYAKFLTWFIETYPESRDIMKKNPEYQNNFK